MERPPTALSLCRAVPFRESRVNSSVSSRSRVDLKPLGVGLMRRSSILKMLTMSLRISESEAMRF